MESLLTCMKTMITASVCLRCVSLAYGMRIDNITYNLEWCIWPNAFLYLWASCPIEANYLCVTNKRYFVTYVKTLKAKKTLPLANDYMIKILKI